MHNPTHALPHTDIKHRTQHTTFLTMTESCLAPQLYFLDSEARFLLISLTSSSLLPLWRLVAVSYVVWGERKRGKR